MAILKARNALVGWTLLGLVLVPLAGCFLADVLAPRAPGPVFGHRLHVEEQGLDCTDCHAGAEDSDEPGMPVPAQCALCHAEPDAEKPPEERIAALFADGAYAGRRASRLADEVLFSHRAHVEAGGDCAACHGAIEATERTTDAAAVPMDECTACHAALGVANDCATCHREIRTDRPPPSHAHDWLRVHGSVVRGGSRARADRCSECHGESSCADCHQTDAPPDHTNHFRRRGHALSAAFDRARCAACHEPDSCNRCHAEALPSTHRGSWSGTRSTHCLACHFPLRAEGCFTCHKSAEGHSLAPPQPANHFPGMDCRQCHGLTAPLPHADNGSDCTLCHP
jgi:hypothetical protein